ncbi:MAG: virulence RhuM family protein [Bacteroidales bacterium]|nr:virulence RhuM family protein [Bacteroidales bacterium]
MEKGEIILYQPDNSIELEVRIEAETVWLTQAQMAELFQKDRTVVTRHINNVFAEGELDQESNVHFLHIPFSDRPVKLYSLDVIISVGYRVKSQRGTQFRRWANQVLKEYLLKGYAFNQQLLHLEERIDNRLIKHERQIDELSEKVDFFVRTSLPPVEGVFYDGQIFDAYVFASNLIKSAKSSIVLIDNYVDESVLTTLSKRENNVSAKIVTKSISDQFLLDLNRHNSQYPQIDVEERTNIHDRFLIIDDTVYHIGASLKDLGKKLFAFSKLGISPEVILNVVSKT